MVFFLLFLASTVSAALVQSFNCFGIDPATYKISPMLTSAFFDQDDKSLEFQLDGVALEDIDDIDESTNMFTTLRVVVEFTGDTIVDEYVRLCDYVKVEPIVLNISADIGGPSSTVGTTEFTSVPTITATAPAVESSDYVASSSSSDSQWIGVGKRDSASATSVPTSSYNFPEEMPYKFKFGVPFSDYAFNGSCPIKKGNPLRLSYKLDAGSSHNFGSYKATFYVISPDRSQNLISCRQTYVTTVQPSSLIKGAALLSLLFAIFLAVCNGSILMFSPHQESNNPFLLTASAICNSSLLLSISPNVFDFLRYIHFAFFMSGLNIQYPGFFQPIMGSMRMVALIEILTVNSNSELFKLDGVYNTFHRNGILGLFLSVRDRMSEYEWIFFFANFGALYGILILLLTVVTFIAAVYRPNLNPGAKWLKNVLIFFLSTLITLLLHAFVIPFLVLTFYLFSTFSSDDTVEYLTSPRAYILALAILIFFAFICLVSFFIFRYALSKSRKQKLYSSFNTMMLWGLLYFEYDPRLLFFYIFEVAEVLIFSLAVGVLQGNGTAQVVLILVLEVIYLAALFSIRPYFAGSKAYALKLAIVCAKVINIALCIPYIRSLGVSEKRRSEVAYTQLILQLVVIAFLFLLPTILNVIRTLKDLRREHIFKVPDDNDDEYTPDGKVGLLNQKEENYKGSSKLETSAYYRKRRISLNSDVTTIPKLTNPLLTTKHLSTASLSTRSSSSVLELTDKRVLPGVTINPGARNPFNKSAELAYRSNKHQKRKREHPIDYSKREADMLYQYLGESSVDPELQQLWDEREERINSSGMSTEGKEAKTYRKYHGFWPVNWLGKDSKRKQQDTELQVGQGKFEVRRPRQLKVKNLPVVNESSSNEKEKESDSTSLN
ncbi:Hypothetical protein PP7435_CHR2-0776 [Komagataella phaffii CBS 7435]|uniref:TRP C-terminal domain-containing protein n=2 Tax=Komagataella phaffii TaxID=460519 RepID=C4R0X4_KOMPG|nr:Hypothetical protein PAS_chr2-1_0516 [Komagataella phaffii GS115]AOA63076.1 GQ67_00565T0 [Komagataella phaffii]CAH2448329.1 Hypothetical protein BQ9382_C2-4185 [Komagataella phaffii CBS 7435]AOA67956.1 GQ68_00823T0 [Komagataella phaffii GS115]CAY69148.1 Hypothetical protein PAS_chr2-1_0516 [Komagataella phaffii GS115]CCA38461.1 Hypothetical protein PP7435_CHR2-0776 [Komagataella phaffii CBS 7435]